MQGSCHFGMRRAPLGSHRRITDRVPGQRSYVLKNVQKFFAVTGSLYLWGNVDRSPHTRENLRETRRCNTNGWASCLVSEGWLSAPPDHAARTEFMNCATSCFSRLLSVDSDCAADSTCEEAPPASDAPRWTSAILASTCEVPSAARCTFREISWVAAPCSSTADAIVAEISDIRAMVAPISLIAVTESLVADWMSAICWLISSVAFAVCSASVFTSAATTANPLPASPARAASMVAFSAKRLVCPAMV